MNKLYTIALSTLFCTAHIFGMIEPKESGLLVPAHFPSEVGQKILFYAIEYPNENLDNQTGKAKAFICSISYVNKACYNHANDPIITRITINNLTKFAGFSRGSIANNLATPGAKNYNTYSKLLHKVDITNGEYKHFIKAGGTEQGFKDLEELPLDKELIGLCVSKGGDINYKYRTGGYTLIQQVINKYYNHTTTIEAVELVLQLGAKIEATTNNTHSLMYNAIQNDISEIIELLYKYNKSLENKPEGLLAQTAMRKAFLRRKNPTCNLDANDTIIELLLKNNYSLEEALTTAAVTLDKNLVEKFIHKGADLRKIDFSFMTEYLLNSHIYLQCNGESFSSPNAEFTQEKQQTASEILKLVTSHGADTSKGLEIIARMSQNVKAITNILQGNQ